MIEFSLEIRNAHHQLVLDSDQKVLIKGNNFEGIIQREQNVYKVAIPEDLSGEITLFIENPRYFDFQVKFMVSFGPRLALYTWTRLQGGFADAIFLNDIPSPYIRAFAILSKMQLLKPDPSKIAAPQDGKWFHKQMDDKGPFSRDTEIPLIKIKDPVIAQDTNTQGAKRLIYDIQSPVRPLGRAYAFEYKTMTAPKLVMVWHSEKMDFSKIFPAGLHQPIPYHFYFHPTPNAGAAYPYGKDAGGNQPHVGLGYRHLMFESWASVQHYYAMKNVVFVVPVGSLEHQFGEAGSSIGIFTILREINLALHMANNAEPINFLAQDIGRVAVSGFSAGANFMLHALTDRNSPLGQSFVQKYVKEIYSWDGAIGSPNTVPESFGKFIQQWWRSEEQFFRVYTSNAAYDTHLGSMNKFSKSPQSGPAGSYVKSYTKNEINFGTLVVLPDSFFKHTYKTRKIDKDHILFLEDPLKMYKFEQSDSNDLGFPSYTDTHHWFFKVFMYHALIKSNFPTVKS